MKSKKQEEDILTLKYVPLDTIAQWARNRKKHDIPSIIKSLEKHGFKDPMKYEPALNNGAGGIAEGNGRDLALKTMFNQNPKKPPRGIKIEKGKWLAPVLFGVDSKSQAAAESYGIDHNNLTMLGGDLDMSDIMKMWQDDTATMLKELQGSGEMPVSVNADDLDTMLEESRERLSEQEQTIRPKTMLRILVSVPASVAMDVQKHIDELEKIPGVEVDISGN